jgi:two-component system NarL family response regulator
MPDRRHRERPRLEESLFGRGRRRTRAQRRLRVMLAHEHMLYADALIAGIDGDERFEVVAHALDGWEVLELAPAFGPDVLVVNARLPVFDGTELAHRLRSSCPEARVVLVGATREVTDLLGAHEAGASAYLGPDTTLDDLLETLADVATEASTTLGRPVRRV